MRNRCRSDASHRDDFSAAYALAGGDGLEDLEARPVGQSFRDFFNVRAVHWSCLSVTDLRCYPPQGLMSCEDSGNRCNQSFRYSSKYRTSESRDSLQGTRSCARLSEPERKRRERTMKRLEGKVAVVTGGNSGIGLAAAKRLQEEGARVAILGRSKKTLDEAVKTIGNGVVAVQGDVAKLADVDRLYAEVSQKLGKIDVLFVNAGIAKFVPFAETSETTFDEQFDINIKGAYFTIQKALPLLNDGASIILNTSVADSKGTTGTSAYSATKAALRSRSEEHTSELQSHSDLVCRLLLEKKKNKVKN